MVLRVRVILPQSVMGYPGSGAFLVTPEGSHPGPLPYGKGKPQITFTIEGTKESRR